MTFGERLYIPEIARGMSLTFRHRIWSVFFTFPILSVPVFLFYFKVILFPI